MRFPGAVEDIGLCVGEGENEEGEERRRHEKTLFTLKAFFVPRTQQQLPQLFGDRSSDRDLAGQKHVQKRGIYITTS